LWEASVDDRDPDIRRRSLIADLKKLASGWTPDTATPAAAPSIDNWYVDFYPGGNEIGLVGEVTGHPHLGNQIVATSPIVAIDPQLQWAQTRGRFYSSTGWASVPILKLASMSFVGPG
jgi:hypothetical protein